MPDIGLVGLWLAGQTGFRRVLIWAGIGALSALGQAPLGWYPLTVFGLAVAFLGFAATTTRREAFWIGWSFGLGYFGLSLSWIVEPFLVDVARHGWMAPFALLGMAGGLALFWGGGFALGQTRRAPLWLGWSVAMTAVELARAYILTGFPWAMLSYVWLETPLLQLVALIGPHGLTLLTLLVLSFSVSLRRWGAAFAGAAGGVAVGVGIAITPAPQDADANRPLVRLIQPNAEQHLKWDPDWMPVFFERLLSMTAAPSDRRPDIVIWPETSVPALLRDAGPAFDRMEEAAAGRPVIAGVQRFEGRRLFNSMIALGQDGAFLARYDKHHLVPFGEYIPGGDLLADLGLPGLASREGQGYSSGPGAEVLDLGDLGKVLPLICYEAVFPQDVSAMPERADWIVQITNDAWFGKVSGPHQHLAQARFRAVEQGLPMARVANTGITAMIDPAGRLIDAIPLGELGFIDVALPAPQKPTLYSRIGDLGVFMVLLGLTVGSLAFRHRNSD